MDRRARSVTVQNNGSAPVTFIPALYMTTLHNEQTTLCRVYTYLQQKMIKVGLLYTVL